MRNDEEYLPNDKYPNDDEDDDLIYNANVIEVNDDDNNNAHNYDPMHHAHNNDDPHVPARVGNAAMPNNNANMVIMAPNNNANMVIVALAIAMPPEAIILAIAPPPAAVILAIALPLPPAAFALLRNTPNGTILMQYSVKKGLEIFGEIGKEALTQELKQVHDMDIFNPKDPCKMTCEEKKQALEYLIFLKQKKSGRVKADRCADGRKQRKYMNKEETSSLMVATESLLLTCIIDAEEEHDVATVDLPGAFMHTGMNDVVHMWVAGKMAEILAKIDPEKYGPHVTIEQGKTVLYMQLNKALYRMIQAVLLFWRLLSSKLQEWGFTINLYNWCVTNMMICGRQCTVAWHVDDLKISHASPAMATSIIDKLNGEFRKLAPLTVTRGKMHEYLGMTIDYTVKGKV